MLKRYTQQKRRNVSLDSELDEQTRAILEQRNSRIIDQYKCPQCFYVVTNPTGVKPTIKCPRCGITYFKDGALITETVEEEFKEPEDRL